MTEQKPPLAEEALAALQFAMQASDSDTARIQAAKILLDRIAPKKNDEEQKHEADERDAALAEARGLLAEFAALKFAILRQSRALAQAGEAGTNHPAGELEDLADPCGPRLGQNEDGR